MLLTRLSIFAPEHKKRSLIYYKIKNMTTVVNSTSLADALTQFCEQLTSTITHQVTESVREELRTDRESRENREGGQIPKFLTVDEYCAQFHISKATFYRMAGRGQIKVIKKGRRTLIPADSIK